MKTRSLIFAGIMLCVSPLMSNNIQVSNVRLTNQNTTDDFTMVEFDISWENSWRYSGGPSNWDAAWIFIKYKISLKFRVYKKSVIVNRFSIQCRN